MIWEHKSHTIVMLSLLEENGAVSNSNQIKILSPYLMQLIYITMCVATYNNYYLIQ